MTTWESELQNDFDKDYILNGILHGFSILDLPLPENDIFCENYISTQSNKELVEQQILHELKEGHYIQCESKPLVVSALGAVPKDNGKIRLIHDLSQPDGGMNAYVTDSSTTYTSVDKATQLMPDDCYLAKFDIKSAYRHVPIAPACYQATGLSWNFSGSSKRTFMYDTRLPFGSAKSCQIFQRLTDAIVRMISKRGHTVVAYLDDFLVIGKTFAECKKGMIELHDLLTSLGFVVNEEKLVYPTQHLTFLGIDIDTKQRTLALPKPKLEELRQLIISMLSKKWLTKKQLEHCLGKLNWAAQLIPGARVFMRHMINLLTECKSHRRRSVKTNRDVVADLEWWKTGLLLFNGTACFIKDTPLPAHEFSSDSCKTAGGAFCMGDWFYAHWESDWPKYSECHINVLETLTVLLAAHRWGENWSGKRILVRTDNTTTAAAINKGSCRQPQVMHLIRELYWLSIKYNFKLSASFLPGKLNSVADAISRLNEQSSAMFVYNLLKPAHTLVFNLFGHMSHASYCFLQAHYNNKCMNY